MPAEAMTEILGIRLAPSEFDQLRYVASVEDRPPSAWARRALLASIQERFEDLRPAGQAEVAQ